MWRIFYRLCVSELFIVVFWLSIVSRKSDRDWCENCSNITDIHIDQRSKRYIVVRHKVDGTAGKSIVHHKTEYLYHSMVLRERFDRVTETNSIYGSIDQLYHLLWNVYVDTLSLRMTYRPIVTRENQVIVHLSAKRMCIYKRMFKIKEYDTCNFPSKEWDFREREFINTRLNKITFSLLYRVNWETAIFKQYVTMIYNLLSNVLSILGKFLVTLVCFVYVLKTFRDEKNKTKLKEKCYGKQRYSNKHSRLRSHVRKDIFRLTYTPAMSLTVFPFSLNHYVEDMVKKQQSGDVLMKYEWSRYLSFKKFPVDSVMMPLRLAQAGFFYTGQRQEVKCFCCGMVNDSWTVDETAMQVHRQLSPHCKFIRGDGTENVSIHAQDYYSDITKSDDVSHTERNNSGASGGPDDLIKSDSQIGTGTSPTQCQNVADTCINNEQLCREETPISSSGISSLTDQGHHRMTCEMKHPEYADFSARLSSYQHWALLNIQDPVELAEAGLFYVGVKDFVRCYYCGLGLKNWEVGDNPWHEHRRWSDRCGHIANTTRENSDQSEVQQTENLPQKQTTTTNTDETHCGNKTAEVTPCTRSTSADMDSAAARSVLEMGYSRERVAEAIIKFQQSNQLSPLSGISLMEILLGEQEEPDNRSETATETTAPTKPSNETSPKPKSKIKEGSEKPKTSHGSDTKSLAAENKALKEQTMCKICMDSDANVVFLPCGHMVSCQTCAGALRKCAVCRNLIRGSVRVYQS